ncbi:hypothetical protein IDJ75_00510 [Mucilaginibacter rigui]|uniref:DUF4160 domain-containing protein n=1 Tax=Mucilaginibacter rigui TaxID=534635 RepID=A0ABR7WZH4_9SPHI|nr:hypothetical protein [Mucilaginibacter rigui]MBD1383743.1 hypothetical protein [Mucilaginibacter rigui]
MLPLETFSSSFEVGNIYWFVNPQINSNDPHPHVCVGTDSNEASFLICGTSQFEKKKRYFELNNVPFETLVWLDPTNLENNLYKDTYINCNDIQRHNYIDLYINGSFSFYGKVSDSELYQIKNGVIKSDLLEEDLKDIVIKQFPDF